MPTNNTSADERGPNAVVGIPRLGNVVTVTMHLLQRIVACMCLDALRGCTRTAFEACWHAQAQYHLTHVEPPMAHDACYMRHCRHGDMFC